MNKILFFVVILTIMSIEILSQNRIDINFGYGNFIVNSDNSTKIMSNDKFRDYVLYSLKYRKDNLLGIDVEFAYSYQQITKKDMLQFVRYDPGPNPSPPPYTGDVKLINHIFDIDYSMEINKYFLFGIGPSFIIVNRIIDVDNVLYDKLASSGIGVNSFAELLLPINDGEEHFYFTSKLKLRYTYSVWFDKGIRKLDDYDQEYFTVQLLVGIGYAF